MKPIKQFTSLFLAVSLLNAPSSAIAAASRAAADPGKDNRNAITSSNKRLKTVVPTAERKHAPRHVIELRATQNVRQLGNEPVERVSEPLVRVENDVLNLRDGGDDTGVIIERPSADSLIKVQENLNSFSLDARYIERIGLQDALSAALAQNLEIENSYAGMKSQKWNLVSAATGFLPNLNAGYNLFGVKGSFPDALLGGSTSAGSAAGAGQGNAQAKLPSSIQLLTAGFTQNVYQGGKVTFSTLEQRHRLRAASAGLKTNINDVLLNATKRYYDLLLNEALLSIRTRAVAISQEQLRLNTVQERAGTATGLDVLQSQAQLASDEQNLVDQQNSRRQAAIQLSHILNASFSQDLESREKHLRKRRLIRKNVPVEELLKLAIDNRPELKQFEELRLAAKRAIMVAQAPLQPNISLNGAVYGIGAGSSSLDAIYTLNFGIKWALGGMGTTDAANIQRSRWNARQAAVQAKQSFLKVFSEVRSSYDTGLASDKRIERASIQIRAAEEELRIAKKRMETGIGLNIDVLNAQRDLTQASINKARAVVDFNVAQAQLLRDIGAISVDSVMNGARL